MTIVAETAPFILLTPSGDLTPIIDGTPAPRMVPGKVDSAFCLEGAELNYGKPTAGCFDGVNLCTNGLCVSLWVKFYASKTSPQMILDGSCFYPETRGISIFITADGLFCANVFDDNTEYKVWAPYEDLFHWQPIVFTWIVSTDVILYLNGCPVGTKYSKLPHAPKTQTADFKIGGNLWGGETERGNIALDHVLMWYDVLTQDEVWQLYIQGGQVCYDIGHGHYPGQCCCGIHTRVLFENNQYITCNHQIILPEMYIRLHSVDEI